MPLRLTWQVVVQVRCYRLGRKVSHATLRDLETKAESTYVSPFHFAYVYAGLGQDDRAIDWLERAVTERAGPVVGLKGSFLFSSLHAHPRFRTILRELHLA